MRTKYRPKKAIPTRAIVLGRGIVPVENPDQGKPGWQLSQESRMRVQAAAMLYHTHLKAFRRRGSLIVCTGGWARMARDHARPPEGISEGRLSANYLLTCGVPHNLIEYEGESGSTIGNFTECIRRDFFPKDQPFSPDDPLAVVAGISQARRRGVPIAMAAYGITELSAVRAVRAEREGPRIVVQEWLGRAATLIALDEARVQAYDADTLALAEQRFAALIYYAEG